MDNLNFQYNYKIPELSKDIKKKISKKSYRLKKKKISFNYSQTR